MGMRRRAFYPAVLLAVVFVAAKLACVWPFDVRRADDLHKLLAFTIDDILVATVFGVVAALLLRATRGREKLNRVVWWAVLVCGTAAVVFSMINIGVYRSMRQPLNLRILTTIDRLGNVRSSLEAHTDRWMLLQTLCVPIAFLLALRQRAALFSRRPAYIVAIVFVVAWIAMGRYYGYEAKADWRNSVAARNPQRDMVTSVVKHVLGWHAEISGEFPREYLDDFRPAAARQYPELKEFGRPPRNVIVIVLESTSAQYMAVCGAPWDTTPRLSAETGNAIVFDHAYANIGYTYCAMMPLVYSIYPGPPWAYRPEGPRAMPRGLAAAMKEERGCRTAFFSAADPSWGGMDSLALKGGMQEVFGPDQMGGRHATSWGTTDRAVVDKLIDWIDTGKGKPFFALAWTNETHDPYTSESCASPVNFTEPDGRPVGRWKIKYLNSILQVDGQIGRLLDFLRQRGLADDTLVVITGDHGEAFGDWHPAVSGHGGALFEENLRVPLIFWNPRMFAGGRRIGRAGSHVDLNPTLAHLLGLKPQPDWQGASLLSDTHPGRAYLEADRAGVQFGMMNGRYKYMLCIDEGYERLYDLQIDPHETHDVSADRPDLLRELRMRVSAYVKAEDAYLAAKKD